MQLVFLSGWAGIVFPAIASTDTAVFNIRKFQLPVEAILTDMEQDQFGFIWIGSENGLWRWDGGNFKHYQKDTQDTTALTSNRVSSVFEDKRGVLWVGTYGGGLHKYNRNCDCFKRYINDPDDRTSLSFNEVKVIYETSNGDFFIGTDGGGLNLMDRETETFQRFQYDEADENTISHNNILSLAEHPDGRVFVGTWKGLNIFDPQKEIFQRVFKAYKPKQQFHFSLVQYGDRLLSDVPPSAYLTEKNELVEHSNHYHGLSGEAIDAKGRLWALSGSGINILDENLKVIHALAGSAFYDDPQNRQLRNLFHNQKTGDTWVLGDRGSFFLIDQKAPIFKPFLEGQPAVHLQSTPNYLWVADGVKVTIYDKTEFTVVRSFPFPMHNPLMESDSHGTMYLADQLAVRAYNEDGSKRWEEPHGITTEVKCLALTRDSVLWIGRILGVSQLDLKSRTIRHIHCNPNAKPNELGYFHHVHKIFQSSSGEIWLGTDGDGLKKYHPKDQSFTHYRHVIGDTTTLNGQFIRDLKEDQQGRLWVGSMMGVCCLNDDGKSFSRIQHDALRDVSVTTMEVDDAGGLWVGSRGEGLYYFEPDSGEVMNLNSRKGLSSDHVTNSLKLTDGRILVGTEAGLMVFDPEQVHPSASTPSVYLSNLLINNEQVAVGGRHLTSHIMVADSILLEYSDNKFELEFRAIHYDDNDRCQYAYKLEGFDEDWVAAKGANKATYTNIPAGQYKFMVKTSNEDGVWNEAIRSIHIAIAPPYWELLWVRLLFLLLMAGIIAGILVVFIRREKSKNQFKLEKERVKQTEELTQMKLRFFTNISHELRTPLTLIAAPLDKYKQEQVVPRKSVLDMMYKNSKRLLELINQILDFRKLEGDQQPLQVAEQDHLGLIENIKSAYAYWAKESQVNFIVNYSKNTPKCYFDADVVEKIITNLVANAIKFTPRNGDVRLNVELLPHSVSNQCIQTGKMKIDIRDTGVGIPKEVQSKIFDRFYQLDFKELPAAGSGIGLSLIAGLVDLHRGQITFHSEEGRGTHFSIELPVGFQDHELVSKVEDELATGKPEDDRILILVIEDHEDIRQLLREELSAQYRVIEAENGKYGVKLAIAQVPDVIICDVMMPEVNGLQVVNQLKNNVLTDHIPILLLTAKTSIQDKLDGLKAGAEDYIQKPFNISEVKLKVRNVLDSRQALVRKFGQQNLEEKKDDKEDFLSAINQLLHTHLADNDFSIDELCLEMGVGRSQLYRKLMALTGKSIKEYINTHRLTYARQLLETGEYSVKEVAFRVGFNDNHYFSRSFKKEFGYPPSHFTDKKKNLLKQ
ncbi:hybrid sensor histidine kinase/response regulator transcription factor [Marinoscillum furvescens]|uniref:hybrid sensor histidine kinase/response regulator transcription factor n=1 Tax=Marinoscillum furvescens TaxID=1026 RepID=UPI001473FAC8|nr:hybrid sensor histidine kinase/response regulator transcription factor [Marinoscillum furvescens]